MKQLACEMCGSPDLIKQDGLFVCQNCGTKYSVEEARKMMIDGPIDVSGSTVIINNSDKKDNLYQVARRFRDDNNASNAEKYYQMILVEDPTSWEASFYVVYFNAMECKIAEIASAANSVSNCLKNVFSLIKTNCAAESQNSAVNEVVKGCIYISNYLFYASKNRYNEIDTRNLGLSAIQEYKRDFISRMTASRDIMYVCGNSIDNVFQNNKNIWKNAITAWNAGIELHNKFIAENKSMYHFYDDTEDLAIIASYERNIVKNDEKGQIELEIKSIDEKLKHTYTPETAGDKQYLATSIVIIIIGIFVYFLSHTWGLIIGSLGIIGVFGAISEYDKHKDNQAIIDQLNEERKKKWHELNSISKEKEQSQISQQEQVPQQVMNQQNKTVNSSSGPSNFQYNQIPNNIPALMYTVGNMNSAKEIYEYLMKFTKYYPNVFTNEVMERLRQNAYAEKMYGNQKQSAILLLRQYFNIP